MGYNGTLGAPAGFIPVNGGEFAVADSRQVYFEGENSSLSSGYTSVYDAIKDLSSGMSDRTKTKAVYSNGRTADLDIRGELGPDSIPGQDNVVEVVIGGGVTSIGDSAFGACSCLSAVTIPDSVTAIGTSAFRNCGELTGATIPDGVTSIGAGAFAGCGGLTALVFEGKTLAEVRKMEGCPWGADPSVIRGDPGMEWALSSFAASADYWKTEEEHLLRLRNGNGDVLSEIDCDDFVKDGMVTSAYVSGDSLVIVFNTDAGKDPVSIDLSAIFDPGVVSGKADKAAGATAGHLAGLNADGNLADSGLSVASVVLTNDINSVPTTFAVWSAIQNTSIYYDILWDELWGARHDGHLVPGRQYRITDYVATVSPGLTSDISSAGHPFDVIVTADDERTLNEAARAVPHENDDYFANSRLEAWKIWYSFDNDTARFRWADPDGKGVVYRMVDEYGNDFPYDFKGLLFRPYVPRGRSLPAGTPEYVYTFGAGADGSLDGGSYGNSALPYLYPSVAGWEGQVLNCIAFLCDAQMNTFGRNCRGITFAGNGASFNTCGTDCRDIFFAGAAEQNIFEPHAVDCAFGARLEACRVGSKVQNLETTEDTDHVIYRSRKYTREIGV